MSVLPTCVWVPLCALCPQRIKESIISPGANVTNSGEPPNALWEQNTGSLKEQRVL